MARRGYDKMSSLVLIIENGSTSYGLGLSSLGRRKYRLVDTF
jgi:hypothetical protein